MMKSGYSSKSVNSNSNNKNPTFPESFHSNSAWKEDTKKFENLNRKNGISEGYRNYPFVQKIDFYVKINKIEPSHSRIYYPQISHNPSHIKSSTVTNIEEIKLKTSLVDPTSEQIIKMKERIPKVEERLLKAGKDMELKREEIIKSKNQEIIGLSTPKVKTTIYLNRSEKTPQGDIISRLLKYKDIYAQKKASLENKFYENKSFTFEPVISHSVSSQYLIESKKPKSISIRHQN